MHPHSSLQTAGAHSHPGVQLAISSQHKPHSTSASSSSGFISSAVAGVIGICVSSSETAGKQVGGPYPRAQRELRSSKSMYGSIERGTVVDVIGSAAPPAMNLATSLVPVNARVLVTALAKFLSPPKIPPNLPLGSGFFSIGLSGAIGI